MDTEKEQKQKDLRDFLERTRTSLLVVEGRPENDPVVYALVRDLEEGRDLIRHLDSVGVEHMIIGNYGGELAVINRGDMGDVRETIKKLNELKVLSEPMAKKLDQAGAGQGTAIT